MTLPIHLIISPCRFERRTLSDGILSRLKPAQIERVEAGGMTTERLMERLNTRSLFGETTAVVLEGIEKLKKAELDALASYIQNPSPFSYLILSGSSSKIKPSSHVSVTDLSGEKPGAKQRRLRERFIQQAAVEKKVWDPAALEALLKLKDLDMASLDQEVFKLLCFIGERPRIELKDVQALCVGQPEALGWHTAEALIWDPASFRPVPIEEISDLLPLIGQIRYQLQTGCKIADLIKRQASLAEMQKEVPYLKEKYLQRVKLNPTFFKKGMELLFNLELACKSASVPPALLWDLFKARLQVLAP
jgi:DNA polymerase III subunit delta